MVADPVVGRYLETEDVWVSLDVIVDRELAPGTAARPGWGGPEASYAGVVAQPMVAAMVEVMRRRIQSGQRFGREPVFFEIAIGPEATGEVA
ncbi:hypothetical protein D3C86_2096870 [compost metagenome]